MHLDLWLWPTLVLPFYGFEISKRKNVFLLCNVRRGRERESGTNTTDTKEKIGEGKDKIRYDVRSDR